MLILFAMDEMFRDWMARIIISLVPVIVALSSIVLGNPLLDAVGEGSATFAYLLVLLSSENVVLFAAQSEKSTTEPLMWQVMYVIFAMVLWMLLILVRVAARVNSLGQIPLNFIAVVGLCLALSAFVLRTHRRLYGLDTALRIELNKQRFEERVQGNPTIFRSLKRLSQSVTSMSEWCRGSFCRKSVARTLGDW